MPEFIKIQATNSFIIRTLKWISDNHKIIKTNDCLFAAVLFNKKEDDHSGESSIRILGDGSITINIPR